MGLGTTNGSGQLPTSGLGFIGAPTGSPNAPANPGTQGPMLGNLFRALPPQQQAGSTGPMPGGTSQQSGPMPGGNGQQIGQIMSQLHPQAIQALRGIPPQTLQHLHNAGLIHPGLMQHMYGQR